VPYRIVPDESTFAQVAALPVEALAAYAQVLDGAVMAGREGRASEATSAP
jgi:hypothetical protein